MATVCPICEKDDAIQKISAIFSAGFASGIDSYTQTELSRRLAPPVKPLHPSSDCLTIVVAGFIFGGTLIGVLVGLGGDNTSPCIIMSITLGIAGLLIYFNNLQYKKRLSEFKAIDRDWELSMNKWNELYYCTRDDCVFNMYSGKYASSNNIRELL